MRKRLLYLIVLICFNAESFAQVSIDSLLKKASFDLYDNPANAIAVGKKILIYKNAKDEQKIEALLLISTGYSSERNYPKSLEYAVKAAQLLPKTNDDKFKFIIYSRLGVQYQQLKIYDKAHSYLDKAIRVAENTKQKFNMHKLLGFNYGIRGMVYKEQMSCDIAQNYFNKSLYHYRKRNHESINNANISVIVYNKGNCFISLNQIDSAKICFTDSYDHADKISANSLKAFAYKGLAEVNTLEGKYDTAINLLLEASKMSENVGDLVLNQGLYKGLADNYFATNAIQQYDLYHRKYEETTALIKKNNTNTINQFILQINSESDKEIAQIQSNSLYYQISLGILILLLLWGLVRENFRFQQKLKTLKLQRENLENQSRAKMQL